jgi:hypothetical protein
MTEPAGQPADIIELILADHRRIGRLCHALNDTARHDGGPRPDWMPGHMWQRLADLLVAHTRAEEETWYLPLFGTGPQVAERIRDSIADHDEIRGIIGAAAVQPAGSAAWWRTVRTVLTVSAEHLEPEERDVRVEHEPAEGTRPPVVRVHGGLEAGGARAVACIRCWRAPWFERRVP